MNAQAERIKKIVESDESGGIRDTLAVAQSDIYELLGEFMDINDLTVSLTRTDSGYKLTVEADVAGIYGVGKVTSAE